MKDKKKTAKSTPSTKPIIVTSRSGFPDWIVFGIMESHVANPYPDGFPALQNMLLKDEIKRRIKNPPWSVVEDVIRELDPGHFNSFACLSVPGNNYVQCLRGFNGWHLEWRVTKPSGDYIHYRACYPDGSKKPYELKKHDWVSDGQHRDLLKLEDVIGAFHSFHQNLGLPGSLKWRKFDI